MTSPDEHARADAAWGDTEPVPEEWRSGPWRIERRGDELADVHYDGTLVLRSVRAVARDRDWATVPTTVIAVHAAGDGLTLSLRMEGLGATLDGTLRVQGEGDRLRIDFSCVSHTDFLRARLGLLVLHPPSVAGAAIAVTTPDGERNEGRFPEAISPHQPAFDIRRLEWAASGVAGSIDFEGDVFEMEDQRNWTDASYKTYSTPLALPFPVLVAAGEELHQSLTLTCRRVGRGPASSARSTILLEETGWTVPGIGVGAATAPDPAPELSRPAADWLLVELDLTTSTWCAALQRAVADARGVPLDVRIVSSGGIDLSEVAEALAPLDLVRIGIYDKRTHVTGAALAEALRAALGGRVPRVPVVGGARSHFTELNRNAERLASDLAALTFPVTPQMHARERAQLVESVAMQRLVARDAVRIAAGRPVLVGPVTLLPHFNAVATTPPPAGDDGLLGGYGAQLYDATDPRQASAALAAWTLASAVALAVPGVAGVTWFEQWGPRGLVSAAGEPFPAARVLGWLHEVSGLPMLADPDAGRDGVWVLAAHAGERIVVLAANLTANPQRVSLVFPGGHAAHLDLGAFEAVRSGVSGVSG
jgi:hypothetical protein